MATRCRLIATNKLGLLSIIVKDGEWGIYVGWEGGGVLMKKNLWVQGLNVTVRVYKVTMILYDIYIPIGNYHGLKLYKLGSTTNAKWILFT